MEISCSPSDTALRFRSALRKQQDSRSFYVKLIRLATLFVATAAFLAACGTTDTTSTPEQGSLTVVVNEDAVTVDVTGNGVDVTETVNGSRTWDLDPGTYTVTASKDGYVTADGEKTAVITEGENTPIAFSFALADLINGNPASVSFTAFTDEQGEAFPTVADPAADNDADKTVIVAAQRQDNVCVEMTVTNEDGDPLRNAPVDFDAVDTSDFVVTGGAGCQLSNAADSVNGIVTDDEGKAYFYIRGATAPANGTAFVSSTEPASINVTVRGSGEASVSTETQEFRAWFIDMTHLHYVEAIVSGADGFVWAEDDSGNLEDLRAAETRVLEDFGVITNVWNDEDLTKNRHHFDTIAKARSTDAGPYHTALGLSDSDTGFYTASFDDAGEVVVAGTGQSLATGADETGFSGFMVYELTGGDTSDVEWANCHATTADGLSCIDNNISPGDAGVTIQPKSSIAKEDLPIDAEITATYYFAVNFAGSVHALPLKDYTYTKRWVGAYLGIDKYVDQHVLTWAGPDVTMGQSSATGNNLGDELRSTVNIVVTNPSNAPLYDVAVVDGVPPEFGVVESSISNGGTYDATNHSVTWNSQDLPEFQTFENGADPVVLTFDVYARQKPGFCWSGDDAIGDYVVDRLDATVVSDADMSSYESATDAYCYGDPYMVTNGDESRSVVASGWPEADYDVNTDQVSFFYSPRQDESDIHVVRPLMELTKVLDSEPVMVESELATFTITAESIDRVDTEQAYEDLAALYPWEFGGALGSGTGHEADGSLVPGSTTASEVRVNPYLGDVQVYDAFEVGLDFTQAQDFDGSIFTDSSTKVEDKDITFDTFDLAPGESKQAVVKLTGVLPSAAQASPTDVTALKNANKFVSDTNEFFSTTDQNIPAWMNCAYLTADQLNQPSVSDANVGTIPTVYTVSPTSGFPTNWWDSEPWGQVEILSTSDAVSLVDSSVGPVLRQVDEAANSLEACATVAVAESPDLGINVRGEFFVSDSDLLSGTDEYTTVSQVDILDRNETFTYIFSIETSGGQNIKNATFAISLENQRTVFTGSGTNTPAIIESSDGGATWSTSSVFSRDAYGAQSFEFSASELPNDMQYRIGIPASAQQDGQNNTTFTATYTNNTSQDLPLESTDSTSVTD